MLRAKKDFHNLPPSKTLDKNTSCEILFTTLFISHLIQRSFPAAFQQANKNSSKSPVGQSKFFCIESRMRAWNYLSSLLSQRQVLDN
jgi:hypothetical protein